MISGRGPCNSQAAARCLISLASTYRCRRRYRHHPQKSVVAASRPGALPPTSQANLTRTKLRVAPKVALPPRAGGATRSRTSAQPIVHDGGASAPPGRRRPRQEPTGPACASRSPVCGPLTVSRSARRDVVEVVLDVVVDVDGDVGFALGELEPLPRQRLERWPIDFLTGAGGVVGGGCNTATA
jgi:hypothetical protein